MLKMTKTKQAPAPYVPSPLVQPNPDEVRNGWNAESLTKYLRNAAEHEVSFAQERLVRARFRERLARKQIECFRRDHNVNDGATGTTNAAMRRLERLCDEAEADARLAQELWDRAVEELS